MSREEIVQCLSERLDEMRRRFSVRRLALFGSAARNQTGAESDIDVLVVFEGKPTFDGFMDLKFYLEDLFHKPVDLVTEQALRPQIRSAIEGELIHVA
jgi:predicted nucleotidyltransferase